jgi:hypothetical protein
MPYLNLIYVSVTYGVAKTKTTSVKKSDKVLK